MVIGSTVGIGAMVGVRPASAEAEAFEALHVGSSGRRTTVLAAGHGELAVFGGTNFRRRSATIAFTAFPLASLDVTMLAFTPISIGVLAAMHSFVMIAARFRPEGQMARRAGPPLGATVRKLATPMHSRRRTETATGGLATPAVVRRTTEFASRPVHAAATMTGVRTVRTRMPLRTAAELGRTETMRSERSTVRCDRRTPARARPMRERGTATMPRRRTELASAAVRATAALRRPGGIARLRTMRVRTIGLRAATVVARVEAAAAVGTAVRVGVRTRMRMPGVVAVARSTRATVVRTTILRTTVSLFPLRFFVIGALAVRVLLLGFAVFGFAAFRFGAFPRRSGLFGKHESGRHEGQDRHQQDGPAMHDGCS